MNIKNLNTGYCGLALGITGAFNTLKYLEKENGFIELFLLGAVLFLLTYYALKALKDKEDFITGMRDRKTLSLLPAFLMALSNISAHINLKSLWLLIVGGHLLYGLFFYRKVLFKGSPLVSYYIPLVGIAINIPHAHYFQMDSLGRFLLFYGIMGYLIVSWRLILHWRSFMAVNPLPLMGVLCAPLSLCIQGSLIYLDNPLMIKGALVISLITTLIVYMIVPAVFMAPFSLSWASLTFPTSAAAMAHLKGGVFLGSSKLMAVGYCEIFLSLMFLLIVSMGTFINFFLRTSRFQEIDI